MTTTTPRTIRFAREDLDAVVTTSIADPELSDAITSRISRVLSEIATPSLAPRVIRVRTHRRLASLAPDAFTDAIAIVHVHVKARRLAVLVDKIRAMNPLGVQLVWDSTTPTRDEVEQQIFAILENARATPAGPPVILHTTDAPALALRFLISSRGAARATTTTTTTTTATTTETRSTTLLTKGRSHNGRSHV